MAACQNAAIEPSAPAEIEKTDRAAADIILNSIELKLAPGDTFRMEPTLLDRSGAVIPRTSATLKGAGGYEIDWTSSNPRIATVDITGLVTAVEGGTALITASTGDAEGSANAEVDPSQNDDGKGGTTPKVSRIAISPDGGRLDAIGAKLELTATPRDSKGASLDSPVTWSSKNPEVASVDASGSVIARAVGAAFVVATSAGVTDSVRVDVQQVVTAVTISPRTSSIDPGDTLRLAPTPVDASGAPASGATYTWTSSDTTVAKVSSKGQVTAVRAGTADISATAKNTSVGGRATIKVENKVASVAIKQKDVTLGIGEKRRLEATAINGAGVPMTERVIAWRSTDGSIARIDQSGEVSARAAGTVRIIARADATKIEDTTTVVVGKVAAAPAPPASPAPTTPPVSPAPPMPAPKNGIVAAFPGAEGWGAVALDRCRSLPLQVLTVSNTNSTGSGTLDQAVKDVRSDRFNVVVFTAGGKIVAPSDGIRLSAGCVYFAGQTAPGDGVVIEGRPTAFQFRGTNDINDVVMRYLRFRGRNKVSNNHLIIAKGERIMLDHLSFSWSDNYLLALLRYGGMNWSGPIRDVSIQHTLIGEVFASHPTAFVLGSNEALKNAATIDMRNIAAHRNLMVSNSHRNPMTAADNAVYANNVIYNWLQGAGMMNRRGRADWINNYGKAGPMTKADYTYMINAYCDGMGGDFSIYATGNVGPKSSNASGDNWSGSSRQIACYNKTGGSVGAEVPRAWRRTTAQGWNGTPHPVKIASASQAYNQVINDVGANARVACDGSWTSAIDRVDARLISQVRNGNGPGKPPANESEVGGFPSYSKGSACADSDKDGLPDAFEQRWGSSNTALKADAMTPSGYLMIEHYVNGTSPR